MFDRIGHGLKDCVGENFGDRVDAALDIYKQATITITKDLVTRLNQQVQRSMKNHAEVLEEELLQILDYHEASILSQITRRMNVAETIALEERKRETIRSGYTVLTDLGEELTQAGIAGASVARQQAVPVG